MMRFLFVCLGTGVDGAGAQGRVLIVRAFVFSFFFFDSEDLCLLRGVGGSSKTGRQPGVGGRWFIALKHSPCITARMYGLCFRSRLSSKRGFGSERFVVGCGGFS